MSDFFFQIVLFLAGATIGIAAPLLPRGSQKWAAGILALILLGISLVWIGYTVGYSVGTGASIAILPGGAIPSTPPISPLATTRIVSTLPPVSLGTISVAAHKNEGVRFTASWTGIYEFEYDSGAYSRFPFEQQTPESPTWTTALRIFMNRPLEWHDVTLSEDAEFDFLDRGLSSSSSEAESRAKGQSIKIPLSKGDYLTFVGIDTNPYYFDNPGEVVLKVSFFPTVLESQK